jgi:hypothetical protein
VEKLSLGNDHIVVSVILCKYKFAVRIAVLVIFNLGE